MTDRSKIVVPRHDPSLATTQAMAKHLGMTTQGSQNQSLRNQQRYGRDRPYSPITFLSYTWYRENVASGALTTGLLVYPTGSNLYSGLAIGQLMARPGKVMGGFMEISADWTAGKIHLCLAVEGVTVIEFDDACAIDGSDTVHPRNASFFVPWEMGYDFADGETIRAAFRTDASFPNGTVDVRGSFLVGYD